MSNYTFGAFWILSKTPKEKQTRDMCMASIQRCPDDFVHVLIDQDEDMCWAAIRAKPMNIKHVKNKTPRMIAYAAERDVRTLAHVPQNEYLCKFAIERNYRAIEYIHEQTEELQLMAFEKDCSSILLMTNPPDYLIDRAIDKGVSIKCAGDKQNDERCRRALENNPLDLGNIRDKKYEYCVMALEKANSSWAVSTIYNSIPVAMRDTYINSLAVKGNPNIFNVIRAPTQDLIRQLALTKPRYLKFVEDKDYDLLKGSIKNHGCAIQHVRPKNRTRELEELAVLSHFYAIRFLVNPDDKLRELAVEADGRALSYIPVSQRTTKMKELAINSKPMMLRVLSDEDKTIKLCVSAYRKDKRSIRYVPGSIRRLVRYTVKQETLNN